jgi:hypothetical protein
MWRLDADDADEAEAILLRTASYPVLAFDQMVGIRKLIRARWSGRLLAVGLAYLLAIEALIASVGLGMSATTSPGQTAFSICSSISDRGIVAPSDDSDRSKSSHQTQCPFCFLAAQSAVHLATIGDGFACSAYADLQVAELQYGNYDGGISTPASYRTSGDPRGPPQFSV